MLQILLRGANGDELKKVKHVVQYGIFAAYHLALETSFLADEGASLPELHLNSPITVALPDKSSSIERSISIVPGFSIAADGRSPGPQEPRKANSVPMSDLFSYVSSTHSSLNNGPSSFTNQPNSSFIDSAAFYSALPGKFVSDTYLKKVSSHKAFREKTETSAFNEGPSVMYNYCTANKLESFDETLDHNSFSNIQNDQSAIVANQLGSPYVSSLQQDGINNSEEPGVLKEAPGPLKEEFPPSPSDHQSILVSLSSRCVWKGTVCERSHLFRIKYYGSFDKPLGRFLRDHLFDQVSSLFLIFVSLCLCCILMTDYGSEKLKYLAE